MPRQCPVCNEAIRFTGSEHEEYWKWVDEVSGMVLPRHLPTRKVAN